MPSEVGFDLSSLGIGGGGGMVGGGVGLYVLQRVFGKQNGEGTDRKLDILIDANKEQTAVLNKMNTTLTSFVAVMEDRGRGIG